jgi:predicted RND superfamily exporter protein
LHDCRLTVSRSRYVASETYNKALENFRKGFSGNELSLSFLDGNTSISSVEATIQEVSTEFEKMDKGKRVFKWLKKLSTSMKPYDQVSDTLPRHQPDDAAFAWGAIKLIIMVMFRLLKKKIILILNQAVRANAELVEELYQTDHMSEAISHLYAYILIFI